MCRVCHLARQLLESLQRRHNDELDLTDEDILCVQMAGLCHDLGECGCCVLCACTLYVWHSKMVRLAVYVLCVSVCVG